MFTNIQKSIALVFFILSLSFFIFYSNNMVRLEKENKIIETENKLEDVEIKSKLKEDSILSPISGIGERIEEKKTSFVNENYVTINVLGNDYLVLITEGESVFEVMQRITSDSSTNFSFNYKKYPGMGVFINEINGVKGKSGSYWIYYVNDKEASVGVSSYILREGDSILWKQE